MQSESHIALKRVSFYPSNPTRNASFLDVALDLEWWDQSAGTRLTEVGIAVQTPDRTLMLNRHFKIIENSRCVNNYVPQPKVDFQFGQTENVYLQQALEYLRYLFSGLGNDCPINLIVFNGSGDEKALRENNILLSDFKRLTLVDVGSEYKNMKGLKEQKKLGYALVDMKIKHNAQGLHNAGNDAAVALAKRMNAGKEIKEFENWT
ncbi:hypothetical protein HDV05_005308 [Chytridiales sp. JEL 0842]|nr:hypothetical protein HDV05_005308 [Chytridiales sp. JEL 0842]